MRGAIADEGFGTCRKGSWHFHPHHSVMTAHVLVPTASVVKLPISPNDLPCILEPYNTDLLPTYEYTTREYLMTGEAAGTSCCTRLLLRCPADATKFTGVVIVEPSHLWGGTSVWRAMSKWLMGNGHAWLEVDAQAPSAMGLVKASNPARYAAMTFPDGPLAKDFLDNLPFTPEPDQQKLEDQYSAFMVRWWAATTHTPELLVQASDALRSGVLGLVGTRIFLSGISQTGGVTRRFLSHSSHLRLPSGGVPFEGLVPCASGGEALPNPPAGVKVIEVLGESEFQSVRWSCGVSGQARGVSHRRPDGPSFRLYEVAGMAHRETRYMSEQDAKKLAKCPLHGAEWSSFPNAFVLGAIWERMLEWTTEGGRAPPAGRTLVTEGTGDIIVRDEHGNALGGVRSVHVDVPVSRIVAATPVGRPSWYQGSSAPLPPFCFQLLIILTYLGTEHFFGSEKLKALYVSRDVYRATAVAAVEDAAKDGFLRAADAEQLKQETIVKVSF